MLLRCRLRTISRCTPRHEAAPHKCVLLSICTAVRQEKEEEREREWHEDMPVSEQRRGLSVELDIRDLDGHLVSTPAGEVCLAVCKRCCGI